MAKLSPKAFQTFLELIASEFTGNEDEIIDNLVRFLTTRVEKSHTESLQSSTRRKWLQDIQQAAETSGTSMEPVYKAVFKALSQVGILALLVQKESHGQFCLTYRRADADQIWKFTAVVLELLK